MTNPFTDQWDLPQASQTNPAPNFTLPVSSASNQPVPTNSQYAHTQTFKNVKINQPSNVQQPSSNIQSDASGQKPMLPMLFRIFNELFSNYDMMICKLFYFLFYSAFGSLFPLIGIYFKQQGMSATETGILIGCRYIVEIFSSPFWGSIAMRFEKGKTILISSLISWIVLTSALAFIRPPTAACIIHNGTNYILYEPNNSGLNYGDGDADQDGQKRVKRWVLNNEHISYFKTGISHYTIYQKKKKEEQEKKDSTNQFTNYVQKYDQQMYLPPNHVIGKSPLTIEYSINYNSELNSDYVSPPFSHMVYKQSEVDEVFILLLLLMLIGEFFASPTITLVDTVTIRKLNNNLNNYYKQRAFGSFGWGCTMLIMGMVLDNSTSFENHPCGPHMQERNHNVCFKVFAFLMTLACIVATQFNFNAKNNEQEVEAVESNELNEVKNQTANEYQTSTQINSQTTDNTTTTTFLNNKKKKFELLDQLKSGVFAQRFNNRPEFVELIENIKNIKLVTLILLAWFMGTGVGLVFSFLFWHLQDLGGSPTLFGIASVINHISEILAYFKSLQFIKRYGHTRVLCFSLLCNFLRFLYISYIDNSWLILPFELVQGITHATAWATLYSYTQYTIPEKSKSSTQAILQIVYSGLGKGSGSIIGGILISAYGTRVTFAIYAFSSLIAIFIFVFIMNVYKKQLAPTVNLGEGRASSERRQNWLDDDLKNRNSLGTNQTETGFVITPHGVPTHAPISSTLNKTPAKQTATSSKTKVDPKLNYNDDLDDYITKNHREWRLTLNKNYD